MPDYAEIEVLMHEYFRLLHEGDVKGIERMFMPTCNLSCAMADGSVTHMTRTEYMTAVASRKAPKELGYPCVGRIVSIDQSGPHTAVAKVECAVQPRHFTDYLTLIKENDSWRIASKIYYVNSVEE